MRRSAGVKLNEFDHRKLAQPFWYGMAKTELKTPIVLKKECLFWKTPPFTPPESKMKNLKRSLIFGFIKPKMNIPFAFGKQSKGKYSY